MALSSKACPACGLDKDSSEFYKYRNGSLHKACKACTLAVRAKYYRANRAKVLGREATRRAEIDWSDRCRRYRQKHWVKPLMQSANVCSKRRGHSKPTITEEWIYQQPLVCPYLNVPLQPDPGSRSPWALSLDRIDNTRGYSPDNVRLTSWIWNLMRGPLTVEEALKALATIRSSGEV